jgi:hypothetical protein
MPITVIVEVPPMEGRDPRQEYDDICRELNDGQPMTQPSDWGEGLLTHSYSIGENGEVVAVDVWEHQRGMEAFMQRVRSIMEREGMEGTVRIMETYSVVAEGVPVSYA